MRRYTSWMESPVGGIEVTVDEDGALTRLDFRKEPPSAGSETDGCVRDDSRCEPVLRQLREYFAGTRQTFDLPLNPEGTGFQKKVWNALLEIPYGATWSYGQLAAHVGNPKGSRAVGAANGANPIAIVVPCHRVIGADGTLTGYAYGVETKRMLLEHEGALPRTLL